jgi:hypothetical protein
MFVIAKAYIAKAYILVGYSSKCRKCDSFPQPIYALPAECKKDVHWDVDPNVDPNVNRDVFGRLHLENIWKTPPFVFVHYVGKCILMKTHKIITLSSPPLITPIKVVLFWNETNPLRHF